MPKGLPRLKNISFQENALKTNVLCRYRPIRRRRRMGRLERIAPPPRSIFTHSVEVRDSQATGTSATIPELVSGPAAQRRGAAAGEPRTARLTRSAFSFTPPGSMPTPCPLPTVIALALWLVCLLVALPSLAAEPVEKAGPNILYVLADDLGRGDPPGAESSRRRRCGDIASRSSNRGE